MEVKSWNEIEREIRKFYENSEKRGFARNILIVDTGALIDLQRESKKTFLGIPRRKKCIEDFLRSLEKITIPILTKETAEEIRAHSRMRINSHEMEISPCILGFSQIYEKNFEEIYETIKYKERENREYEGWLIVKSYLVPLIEEESKREEKVSSADQSILKSTYLFSMVNSEENDKERNLVAVITSDHSHISKGVGLIKSIFKIENLGTIETRK